MGRMLGIRLRFTLAGLVVLACSNEEQPDDVLLVVQAAHEQPSRDDLGIIVKIQSMGGHWLELSVNGGHLGGPACLPTPGGDALVNKVTSTIIFPIQTEAVITVRLLPNGPKASPAIDGLEMAGAGGSAPVEPGEVGPCGIAAEALRTAIVPVQRVNAAVPPAGPGGSGGGGGSGGTGGGAGVSGSAGNVGPGGGAGEAGSAGEGGAGGSAGESDAGTSGVSSESGAGGAP